MLAVDDVQPVAASVVEVGDARERFAQWREGKTGKVLSISVIGDSYSAGQDFYLNKLVQRVSGEAGFAGPGYVGFNHGAALGGTHFKYTRSSEKYFGGGWQVSGLGQASPDSRTVTGRPGAWLQIDASPTPSINTAVTQAKLLYLGNGEPSEIRYRWTPSQDWRPLTLGGSGVQEVPLPDASQAANWALRLEVVKGAPTLFGLWMSNDQGGVRVSKLAASGAASADFYHGDFAWQTQWKAAVSKIPADIYLIMLGGNDQGFGVKPEQYLENVQGLVGMIREIQPAASINLILRQETTRSSAYPMSAYAQVLEPWARAKHLGYADLQCAFGSDVKRYAASMIGPDKIHPVPATGGRLIADYFYRWMVGGQERCDWGLK
ncbi:Lysophospholipase L1 [Pseudomonas reinekei]|jgi:lysophospholipase L1-like esterase|uniref:Lysophospholipase n=1 Tax=Pseudomonas reinekei TaxID=395598 RepID=A0A1H0IF57_PSERE|nr:SGNH/GDSL hydrolase family protein [Pseudomonas reinekei]KAB0486763.1 SGNH/GDSL hydrolase family protein [Pseudomonas reinekei]OLU04241.1 lysophospholipase [Pseudomonas reinekei]SDO30119.1 Lysophospholipase L1 [Pseudomonas reinekei]